MKRELEPVLFAALAAHKSGNGTWRDTHLDILMKGIGFGDFFQFVTCGVEKGVYRGHSAEFVAIKGLRQITRSRIEKRGNYFAFRAFKRVIHIEPDALDIIRSGNFSLTVDRATGFLVSISGTRYKPLNAFHRRA